MNLLFWRRKRRELTDEIDAHLRMSAQARMKNGESAHEATQSAQREFGNTGLVKDVTREVWGWASVERLLQDLRFAARMLRRNPGFTIVAVLTLALGIGANTAIFSIVDAVLLRPLPFDHPSRLVMLHEGIPKIGYPKMEFSPPDLEVFMREQKSFSSLGAFEDEHVDISGQGEPERIEAARVSASLFPMLGAQPMLGRTFSTREDAPGHNVAILSYALWQRRFGGASNVLGQTIELNRQPYTIVGVMAQPFVFPLPGSEGDLNGSAAELYVPMAITPAELQDWGGSYFVSVVGRLRAGVTLDQARSELQSLSSRVEDSYPTVIANLFPHGLQIAAIPFQTEVVGSVRTLLLVLMIAVVFVLLIACANVATLLLSRAAARQKEIAIRTALGATRVRLMRQMFTESLFLALAGGALGIILAVWGRDLILTLVPSSIPLPRQIALNAGMLVFVMGISILAAILFGFAPAFQSSDASLQTPLQEGRSGSVGRPRHRLQGIFVTAEFALALVLLVGAGLLVRSFVKLLETNPGFRPDHLLTLTVPLPHEAYPHGAQVYDFYKHLLERTSALPGVRSAALSNDLPLNGHEMVSITIEGRKNAKGNTPQAICQSWVLGNYFEAMGIPLLQGRWFTPEDQLQSLPVAIVDSSMARKYWPQGAIGKRIKWGIHDEWETVIGVVGSVKERGLNSVLVPHVYRPYSQVPYPFLEADPFGDWHAMNLTLRTQVDPVSLTSSIVAQVHSLDPDLAVANIRTMTQVVSSSFSAPAFNTALLGALAALAVFLAAIGIYGVLAYVVTQQTHDIGIRMALGAKPRDIFALVIGRGARLAAIGSAIGLVAAFTLTRLMKSLLYGVSAIDPLTFVAVVIVLILVALLAICIPARRAMRVDPMVALRYE